MELFVQKPCANPPAKKQQKPYSRLLTLKQNAPNLQKFQAGESDRKSHDMIQDMISWNHVPSGYVKIAIENGHLQLIFPVKMVIFHSYVKLPEGINKNQPSMNAKKDIFIELIAFSG